MWEILRKSIHYTKVSFLRLQISIKQAHNFFELCRMREDGVSPTTKTFTTLIGAISKMGRPGAAVDVFAGFVTQEAEKPEGSAVTSVYAALMAACEKAGQWELAVALYEKVKLVVGGWYCEPTGGRQGFFMGEIRRALYYFT